MRTSEKSYDNGRTWTLRFKEFYQRVEHPGSVFSIAEGRNSAPCEESPEFRQLDFWVGEWVVKNPEGREVGKSSIRRTIGDCVIFENYTGLRGYEGKSFNVYNKTLGKWQQFWVDNRGEVLEFVGEYANGQMLYKGVSTDSSGNDIMHRMILNGLNNQRILQVWDQSTDKGKKWKTVFEGHYELLKEE